MDANGNRGLRTQAGRYDRKALKNQSLEGVAAVRKQQTEWDETDVWSRTGDDDLLAAGAGALTSANAAGQGKATNVGATARGEAEGYGSRGALNAGHSQALPPANEAVELKIRAPTDPNEGQESLPPEILTINMECRDEENEQVARSAPGMNQRQWQQNGDRSYATKDSDLHSPLTSEERRQREVLRLPGGGPRRLETCANDERRDNMGGNNLLENSNAEPDSKNFFIKSENGDGKSAAGVSSEESRAGAAFPRITLGGLRQNPRVEGNAQTQDQILNSGKNSRRDEKIANFSPEALSKLVYDLLQKIDLVKFLTTEDIKQTDGGLHGQNSDQSWMKASARILETVKKHSDLYRSTSPQQRSQPVQIEPASIRQMFIMLNNFAMHYLQLGKLKECSQILHLAWQMDKQYQSAFQNCPEGPRLQAMFYSNFSTYHLVIARANGSNRDSNGNSGGSRGESHDLQLSKKYIHAAIQLTMRDQQNQEPTPADGAAPNSKSGLKKSEVRQIFTEMNSAIHYNNRAVIQMKNGCYDASREHSKKAIQTLEPTVFGLIGKGVIPQVAQSTQPHEQSQTPASSKPKSKEEVIFHELLQVLLVSYFNMAMSMDRDIKSREIYLRGMQLLYQYVPNCQNNVLYRKFQQKYCRKMYDNLEKEQENAREQSTIDLNQPLPEILPLDMRSMPDNQSQTGPPFQENRVVLRRPPAGQQLQQAQSFTIFSESQSALAGGPGAHRNRPFLFQEASAASMPTIYQAPIADSMEHTQKNDARDRRCAEEEPAAEQLGLLRLNQKSSLLDHPQHQPIQPSQQRSQGYGRPSINLASVENVKVNHDFMNISKYNSRGGEPRDEKPAPAGGASPDVRDKRPAVADKKEPAEGRPPTRPPVAKTDGEGLRDGLQLRPQRTAGQVKNEPILPDGRAQEFKQQHLDNMSASNEANQFIPDEKVNLRLNKHIRSQTSQPLDSQNTDSINIRADDSASNKTTTQFNFHLPKNDAGEGRRPANLVKIDAKAPSNTSNDSPATKWEQTAKFGRCATSMSYSMSPGLASQARNQGGAALTPKSGQQQPNVSQFQKQDRQFDFCLTPAQAPDDEAAKQQATLEEKAKELERERTKMQEDNEAWRRAMEEQTRKELEEKKQKEMEELVREKEKLKELNEQLRRGAAEIEGLGQMHAGQRERAERREEAVTGEDKLEGGERQRRQEAVKSECSLESNTNEAKQTQMKLSLPSNTALAPKEAATSQPSRPIKMPYVGRLKPPADASQKQKDQAQKASWRKTEQEQPVRQLGQPQDEEQPRQEPKRQESSARDPRVFSNDLLEEYKQYETQQSEDQQVERDEEKAKGEGESLQRSIYQKQIKALNQTVDVFVTEDTLKFNSGKRNQQEANQASGILVGMPKQNTGSIHPKPGVDPASGEQRNPAEQPKQHLRAALDGPGAKDTKLMIMPPPRPTMPGNTDKPLDGAGAWSPHHITSPISHVVQDRQPFSYQRISERDEKEAGFVELSIFQKKRGFHNEILDSPAINELGPNAQEVVLNLQKLLADFRSMEDQRMRSEHIRRNLQRQNDQQLFNINQQQIDALIYLREHNKLYCPHNLWRFNKKLIEEIKNKKRIVCQRIISLLAGPESGACTVPVKIQIEAVFRGSSPQLHPGEYPADQKESLFYHALMKDNIFVKMSAFGLENHQGTFSLSSQEFSLLELQSTMYFFEGLSLIDPGSAPRQGCSMPFFLLDSFQELCQFVLFHFVQIGGVSQSESNSALQDGGSNAHLHDPQPLRSVRSEELTVDFSEEPNGIFPEPIQMKFLMRADSGHPPGAEPAGLGAGASSNQVIYPPASQANPEDQIQGGRRQNAQELDDHLRADALLGDYSRSLPGHRGYNCNLNIFHVQGLQYKMLITPTFDSQTMLFIRILKQHNSRLNAERHAADQNAEQSQQTMEQKAHDLLENLETLQKIQPKNVGSLQIDIEFKDQAVADEVFKKYDDQQYRFSDDESAEQLQGVEGGDDEQRLFKFESPVQVEDGQQFFDKYFGKIVQALDDYLMEEYAPWFEQFNQDLGDGVGPQADNQGAGRGDAPSQAPFQQVHSVDNQLPSEEQLVNEHKKHKRLFNLIVYLQIAGIKLCIGDKLPNSPNNGHEMEMFVIHKNQKEPRVHDLTLVCLHTKDGSPQIERSKSQGIHSSRLRHLFSETASPGQQEPHPWNQLLGKGSLTDHYFLQLVCKQYLKAVSLHFEDPEASESEGNISNSSESVDSHSLGGSQSGAGSSSKANQAAQPKQACIKVDQVGTVRHLRVVKVFQSQLGDFKYAVPITCELLAWRPGDRLQRYLGVRISVHDSQSSEEESLLFLIDEAWSKPSPAKTPSLEAVMTAVGFDYLLANCVELVGKVEVSESSQHLQTNSELAKDYLGASVPTEDARYDKVHPLVKHDKIDFPGGYPDGERSLALPPLDEQDINPFLPSAMPSQPPATRPRSLSGLASCQLTQLGKHVNMDLLFNLMKEHTEKQQAIAK